MANSSDERRKKIHRTGALGLVLAQAEAKANAPFDSSVPASKEPSLPLADATPRAPHRFYPTKGYGRVPANVCRPWKFADRPEDEFGHTSSLAKSIEANGQVQPALVRLCVDRAAPGIRYEVIAGVARWRSAMSTGGDLDVQIRDLTDVQAYSSMVAENEERQNLSDYARAKRFAIALEGGLFATKTELTEAARISASQMSYFLAFACLPDDVLVAISNIKRMPVRTGYAISTAVRDGFKAEVIRDMARIESFEITRDQIPGVWRTPRESVADHAAELPSLRSAQHPKVVRVLAGKSGSVMCRLHTMSNGTVALKLPLSVSKQLTDEKVAQIIAVLEAN